MRYSEYKDFLFLIIVVWFWCFGYSIDFGVVSLIFSLYGYFYGEFDFFYCI